ncbi:transcription-repair coupling factor, partial [Azonexus sp.]|uniref:transcription-repair coupling factor n=1 Tax=Azonexus sp. TaxID=1872668 RepID=UPI0039E32E2A
MPAPLSASLSASLPPPAATLLPAISLPKTGQRLDLALPPGSADALACAELAQAHPGRLLVVICARAVDAQRLHEEITWFAPALRVRQLPDWETLPYDHFSPHQDLVSERLATLWATAQNTIDILLVPAATALYRLAPPDYLAAYTFVFKKGERLDADKFRAQVTRAGYAHVTQVVAPGEYAIRGGLIDLFPMGASLPFRLDLFGDEIDSIKTFDVDTQRSLYPVAEIRLLPAREFPMDDAARTRFRQAFRETFEGDPARSGIYKDISAGIPSAGIEYYLPLFFPETASLFDYLPAATLFATHGDLPSALQAFWQDTRSRYKLLQGDPLRPLLAPDKLFLSDEAFFSASKAYPRIVFAPSSGSALPNLAINRRSDTPLAAVHDWLRDFPGRVLLLAESAGRRETLAALLSEHGLPASACADLGEFLATDSRFALAVGPLQTGFILDSLAFLTENELFASSPRRSRKEAQRKASFDNWLKDLTELKVGDPVVHESHGIGRYRGLVHMDLGLGEQEFLELHYALEAKLFVPVAQLHVISRYSGAEPDAAPLHTLGSGQWEKAKRKAAEQARDTAAELLALYAVRAARQGHAFRFQENDYALFAEGFGFEETPDQAATIAAVIDDMKSGKPMDRLVCGDVGFGKTEVALRAAFCAVADGKQVAVLCPTTLLCEQHYQTFCDRFADWPVKIAELSRFNTAKESALALKELAEGKIDIVIGTHKLIGKEVAFKRLGLVIIDEEHRFGVRQKERLKAMRAEVDVLTLTATPIPRTLAMSMEGLRDFSVIATAPSKRLAIKTFVSRLSDGIIREAVLRELKRGGQVYFLHNEV